MWRLRAFRPAGRRADFVVVREKRSTWGQNIAPVGRQKAGNCGTRHHEAPDQWLEREMRDVYVRLKAGDGRGAYASRGIANAAHGITAPHRSLAKRMREARRAKAKAELVRRIGEVLIEYSDRLFGAA